jgi:flavin reductase (DIM6/NTAB) family NADH-FMN oxidoreductase RutF/DNA-binding IclR family transcriptional regulator
MNSPAAIDPRTFRSVLGHFPTGVAAITAIGADGAPVGMAVGSFTSVSLDPPLVAFLPDRGSTTFPRIREVGSFCVNVLAGDQESVCRSFAAKGSDKYAGISWQPAGSGAPMLDGAVAWIDCDIDTIHDAGDHFIVVGRVRELQAETDRRPLLFFQGGYGRFSSPSRSAPAEPDLLDQLRLLDAARPEMERVAAELDMECLAHVRIRDSIVILGSAGKPRRGLPSERIGQRTPFVAPLGALFVPIDDEAQVQKWINPDGMAPRTAAQAEQFRGKAAQAHQRGWSIVLNTPGQVALEATVGGALVDADRPEALRILTGELDVEGYEAEVLPGHEYAVRHLIVPVRAAGGDVVLNLSLYGLPRRCSAEEIDAWRGGLTEAADRVAGSLLSPSRMTGS